MIVKSPLSYLGRKGERGREEGRKQGKASRADILLCLVGQGSLLGSGGGHSLQEEFIKMFLIRGAQ